MGIIGGTLLLTLMVAVFVEVTACSKQEEQVISIVQKRSYNRNLRAMAVRVLQLAGKKHLLKKKIRAGNPTAKALLKQANREMYDAIHDIRVARTARPDDSTEQDRDDKISKMVLDVTKYIFGGHEKKTQYKIDKPMDVSLSLLIQRQHEMEEKLDDLVATLGSAISKIK